MRNGILPYGEMIVTCLTVQAIVWRLLSAAAVSRYWKEDKFDVLTPLSTLRNLTRPNGQAPAPPRD
jgi:hypothetical protein